VLDRIDRIEVSSIHLIPASVIHLHVLPEARLEVQSEFAHLARRKLGLAGQKRCHLAEQKDIAVFGGHHTHERPCLLEFNAPLHFREAFEKAQERCRGREALAGKVLDSAPRARGEEKPHGFSRSSLFEYSEDEEKDGYRSGRILMRKCLRSWTYVQK
jgi:hypothetical protein